LSSPRKRRAVRGIPLPPNLSSPRKRGPISPATGARRKAPQIEHLASPQSRTLDRFAGVGMGPRFRGDDKLVLRFNLSDGCRWRVICGFASPIRMIFPGQPCAKAGTHTARPQNGLLLRPHVAGEMGSRFRGDDKKFRVSTRRKVHRSLVRRGISRSCAFFPGQPCACAGTTRKFRVLMSAKRRRIQAIPRFGRSSNA
jgi:hypothetical protein